MSGQIAGKALTTLLIKPPIELQNVLTLEYLGLTSTGPGKRLCSPFPSQNADRVSIKAQQKTQKSQRPR